MNLNTVKTMGVINLTPNSFSDGNQFYQPDTFATKFNQACSDFDVIDLGAESTAAFNSPITKDEELKRYQELFFPLLKSNSDPSITLSIDTYKVDVFKAVATEILNYWPETHIIFNDVSGVIDDDLCEVLACDLPFDYIFSHNLVDKREHTSNHMDYITNVDLLPHMKEYFTDGLSTLNSFKRKIYLDPCFGFSKTREQNHLLLKDLDTFSGQIDLEYSFVFGISRKSFLRFPREMNIAENLATLDSLQALFMQKALRDLEGRDILLRIHDNSSFDAVKNYLHITS